MKNKIINYLFSAIIFIFTIYIFINQDTTTNYFLETFHFIIRIIIPSIFPFMIFINFILYSNCIDYIAFLLAPIGKIFKLSGYGISCLIASILGGFPYSSIIVTSFIKQNKISLQEGIRIINACQFPSLAFLFMGLYTIDKNVMYIIISLYLSSFLMLYLSSFNQKSIKINNKIMTINNDISSIYYQVMNSSIKSIISISFTIIFFNLITSSLSIITNNERLIYYISGLFEFSNSSINILLFENKTYIDYLMLMIIISFSSFSIMFQSMFYLKEINIKIKQLLLSRITIVLISIIIFTTIFYIKN